MRRLLALAAVCCPLAALAAPVRLAGLTEAAEISRDAAGIPHIRADNEHDLFFLQGWVHAEDPPLQEEKVVLVVRADVRDARRVAGDLRGFGQAGEPDGRRQGGERTADGGERE